MTGLSLFDHPVSERDTAFLRSVAHAGGWRALQSGEASAAERCVCAGFILLGECGHAYMTAKGQAYLDHLMRAH